MRVIRSTIETLHTAVLGFWLGALVLAGATAAFLFPLVHTLNPVLPGYMQYEGDHWLIAAGKIGDRVFFAADMIQVGCGGLVVISLMLGTLLARGKQPSASLVARWATVLLVMACLGYNMAVLRPRMQANLRGYWGAAQAGQVEKAKEFETAFSADHPKATNTMGCTAVALLLCIGAAAWNSNARAAETAHG